MTILIPYDRETLEKFKNGKKIETAEEWDVLKDWAAVGFVTFGFLSGTAKLTNNGKFALSR